MDRESLYWWWDDTCSRGIYSIDWGDGGGAEVCNVMWTFTVVRELQLGDSLLPAAFYRIVRWRGIGGRMGLAVADAQETAWSQSQPACCLGADRCAGLDDGAAW